MQNCRNYLRRRTDNSTGAKDEHFEIVLHDVYGYS